ncbi:DUF3078 domain-containing protein [candidate division KSB1 bacterium]|nr:DUF3078 domain-containing protein [candidate division KSB1 bacterium]
MKKNIKIFTFGIIIVISVLVNAQTPETEEPKYGWQKEMIVGINLTQTSFDNYVQGGENSMAWQLNYSYKFVNDQEKTNWANSGKLNYGMIKIGNGETKKSIDEIKLETVYTYKLGINIDPYVAGTGETQFAPGYDYGQNPKLQVSDFMDPLYLRESAGFGYKPREEIKTRLGFSMKQTLTNDYPAPFADDPKTTIIEKKKYEYGIESVTDLDVNITENSNLKSKLELFSNLKAFDQIDVNWDTMLTAKVSEYVNLNFNVKVLYDKDISKKRQLKQALAVGISYNFFK